MQQSRRSSAATAEPARRFPDHLRRAIAERPLRDLAREAGLSEGALRHYLSGRAEPTLGSLVALARATGAGVAQLLGETRVAGQGSLWHSGALLDSFDGASRFPARLEAALGDRTVADLARSSGLSDTALRRMLSAKSQPTLSALLRLAEDLGVNPAWLAAGEGPREDLGSRRRGSGAVSATDVSDYVLATARPRTSDVVPPASLAFHPRWLLAQGFDPDAMLLVTASGEAMAPAIDDGDLVLLDTRRQGAVTEGIYAIERDGRALLRRLQLCLDGTIVARCDHPGYAAETLNPREVGTLAVLGLAVGVWKRL